MDSIINIFASMRIMDVIDIAIVAYVFYKIFMLIRETRAEQLIKGLVVLLVIMKLSEWAKLYVVHFILMNTMTLGLIALIIVFQPELRRALEYIGRNKIFFAKMAEEQEEALNRTIHELVSAVVSLSREQIGALIVMERQTGLNEIASTGVKIDAEITSGLLINIFIPNTPLHDGSVIIRKDRILAAGCFLPLSANQTISKELGTRHRAALGIAEQSDALVIIVSEETGTISVALNGKLSRYLDANTLTSVIKKAYSEEEQPAIMKRRWRLNHELIKKN
ncbi:diadenylate cyclase CdaA [Acidaminobacter sp.]|jgi:diadenylate cyclase|uniref:diadenylate cyclase CdaA n=1 Tax=Acidaminobacter sp. TaxID=1872102 RepID=UPI00137D823C|nr:diadenylate cyclase CdaA [Acidaminobacter sp.]MDK9711699.1 diadenylate cyclase CdaA [Acidaminobacter sp.]MZQ98649.1 TIGR00159 family protein [Acidaminobacter sp.]